MSGNTFGALFRLTTFGESHGPAVGCVVDGCPPRLPIDEALIARDMRRRRPGASKHVTQRQETDEVQILSGIFQGQSTGTPIAMRIANADAKSKDYANLEDTFRPGHADFSYQQKYGIRDHRGGGRSSARETAARVAAGAIARQLLAANGIVVRGFLAQMEEIVIPFKRWEDVDANPFFAADAEYEKTLAERITALRRAGDSCGAVVQVEAQGVPPGLGEPVFDRLDADLAKAMMSINAVKGVEIGSGFAAAAMRGSAHNDALTPEGFAGNNAGGVLGGISSGQDVVVRLAIKPTSSIPQPQKSINRSGAAVQVSTTGRHDPCVGIRAVPVAEAMLCLVLADHLLRQRAIAG